MFFINYFYERYPDFDVNLYRELYDDLKQYNDIQLFGHYHKYGHEKVIEIVQLIIYHNNTKILEVSEDL